MVHISLRNLVRQKRRNILLGAALAIGMTVLVAAGSLGRGISDIILNKAVVMITGHVSVLLADNGNFQKSIFHNKELLLKIVKNTIPEAIRVRENIWVFGKVLGNGKADHLELLGLDIDSGMAKKELESVRGQFRMLAGDVADLLDKKYANPVLISNEKAEFLKVKRGDSIKVRFRTIHGSIEAVDLTVVGIFKPLNLFMARPIYLKMSDLRGLMGYGARKTAQIDIMLAKPANNAKLLARKLHRALAPDIASIRGSISRGTLHAGTTVFGYQTDSAGLELLPKAFAVREGDPAAFFNGKGIAVTSPLAHELSIRPGDTCHVAYRSAYATGGIAFMKFTVTALVNVAAFPDLEAVFINDMAFLKQYYEYWPDGIPPSAAAGAIADTASPVYTCLARQWQWKPYDIVNISIWERMSLMGLDRTAGTIVEARSMYETAAMVTAIESALRSLGILAMLVLFCIVLIGIVNSLHITVKERTREIGALRAMGMQRNAVRGMFLLETFFLTLFSLVAGIIIAFISMAILKTVTVEINNPFLYAILDDGHLHFLPDALHITVQACIIISLSMIAAWFPAGKAAKLDPSRALGHYE